ncbi:MAG TPA: TM1812 family CRISPR-associated protein, partial [Anaerolineaceae bacterium]|nr:TM1812 family CRISPR-associated protein [Anaerolineaceae bacterium]
MKLLTFLGVGKYEKTVYVWNQQEQLTRFSTAASCAFLKPTDLMVFLTEEAQESHFAELQTEIDPAIKIQAIPVPQGRNTQELWQIFDQVSRAVEPGEEVAFDITNGLRSFPL